MIENAGIVQTPPYTLGDDDKVARVMVYTANALFWGEVVVKELIRVNTWLRTNSAPDRICLYNARMVNTSSEVKMRPLHFSEVNISTSQVNLFHLVPPAKDPPDYDPSEPNRRMQPVTVLSSNFRVDGNLRLATQTSVARFLEVARETFSALYDTQVSSITNADFGVMPVPYVLVRQEAAFFALP